MRSKAPILLLAVLLLVGAALLMRDKKDSVTAIAITESGFSPSQARIKKGDTVVFTNMKEVAAWPASDYHPSHGRYAAFDPKEALEPGESWSFTFDRAGVWGMHDHLDPAMKGKIFVLGEEGESVASCLETAQGTLKAECWEAELLRELDERGLSAAFDLFARYHGSDPLFERNCHDVSHLLGIAAQKKFAAEESVVTHEGTALCGFGFYHGFLEAMLWEQGDLGDLSAAERYCEELRRSDGFPSRDASTSAADACYHGIGHAVFDSMPLPESGSGEAVVRDALRLCERNLPDRQPLRQCASGVFNALANAYGNADHPLTFPVVDPLLVCRAHPALYTESCYAELALAYIRAHALDMRGSVALFGTIEDENARLYSITSLVDDDTRRAIATITPQQAHDACGFFAAPAEREACVRGTVIGFRKSVARGDEYGRMRSFCDTYPVGSLERYSCFNIAMTELRQLYPRERVAALCAGIGVAVPACSF